METKYLEKYDFFKGKDLSHSLDYLTGVIDRQTIFDYIDYLIKNNTPFSVCVSDLDNFKTINDTYGHLVGDKVLKGASYLYEQCVKGKGVVGRFGGDEFIFVLENIVEYDDVWKVCHSINENLKTFCISSTGNIFMSATTGIARFPIDAQTQEDLFHIADKALYRGKQKGRNCFIIYLEEKHKNLEMVNNRGNSNGMESILSQHFKILTESHDLKEQISQLLKNISNKFMFDHICIETPTEMIYENRHKLSYCNEFQHIDFDILNKVIGDLGIFYVKDIENIKNQHEELYSAFTKQKVVSTLLVKISAFDKDYGIIRVDATNTFRVWQQDNIIMFMQIAQIIALLLYYTDSKL